MINKLKKIESNIMKQTDKAKTKKSSQVLTYKDFKIKSGDLIEGSISGQIAKGVLFIEHGNYYFCQNVRDGSHPSTTLGFKYGWCFSKIESNRLTESVEITKHFPKENIIDNGLKFTMIDSQSIDTKYESYRQVSLKTFVSGHINEDFITSELRNKRVNCFKITKHPDCCGSKILYDFDQSGDNRYSNYKVLTDDDYNTISSILNKITAAKIVHLSHRQKSAISFIEKLGFEKQFEYKNHNSVNTILVYHLNYSKNSES